MKRDIEQLAKQQFDVVVVGAGIHGACVARDAALRGFRTALIDKGDLCGQTSHNSLKIIHGGIRYLQHLNLKRTFESIREQRIWLSIAPHLVKTLQFVMPTYGHGMRGPVVMWAAIKIYEILGLGRNRHVPSHRKIAHGQVVSKERCKIMVPGIKDVGLTGAALWYDAQVFGADEAVIEMVASAADNDACVANYVSAQGLLYDGRQVSGVKAKDELTGATFDIKGKWVVNAAGPWAKQILSSLDGIQRCDFDLPLTKSMNIVTRKLFDDYAVGLQSARQSDSVVGATKRLYFFTPWEDCTVIGTSHFPYKGDPDNLSVSKPEVEQFIHEINDVYPNANLRLEDVHYCYTGLTPAEEPPENEPERPDPSRSHHSRIIDHCDEGIFGIISLIGVKYTTARLVAERAVDLLCRKQGKLKLKCTTRTRQLKGASTELPKLETLDNKAFDHYCQTLVEQSMAVHLADIVLRRMNLAARGAMTINHLERCIKVMSECLGWDDVQIARELEALGNVWLPTNLSNAINLKVQSARRAMKIGGT